MSQNQHYISQTLLKRFSHIKNKAKYLYFYDRQRNKWNEDVPRNIFCWEGYTEIQQGKNTIEDAFSKIETHLPKTLEAIEEATTKVQSVLPEKIRINLGSYFAYVISLSPFAKGAASVDLLNNLNGQLYAGHGDLFKILKLPASKVAEFRNAVVNDGKRIILEQDKYHQLLHGIQFERNIQKHIRQFTENVKWKIKISPVNVPIADVAIVDINPPDGIEFERLYSLPIGPKLILTGYIFRDKEKEKQFPLGGIISEYITPELAEQWANFLCLSAQSGLVSQVTIPDIEERRKRAETRNGRNRFLNIARPRAVITATDKMTVEQLRFQIVSEDEFAIFCHNPFA